MFRRAGIRLVLFCGDLIVLAMALYIASWLRPYLEFGQPIPVEAVWLVRWVYLIALVVWGFSFVLMDVYNLQKNLRAIDELKRLITSHLAASLTFAGTLYFSYRDISRLQTLSFTLISLLLMILSRLIFRLLLRLFGDRRYGSRRILIVGAGPVGRQVAETVVCYRWTGLRLVGFVDDNPDVDTMGYPHLGPLSQTVQVVQQEHINEVIFALPRQAHTVLSSLVIALQTLQINVRLVPDFFDLVFLRSVVEDVGDMPLITLREPVLNPLQRLVKRLFDLAFATISLVLALPIMALIALTIKITSPGPIIFRQQRVGEHGRLFDMYKFRSMVPDAETYQADVLQQTPQGQLLHKVPDDPRVTRLGSFLRRTSLDELPQLFNILKGDMSLVGPRPEMPWLVERYEAWQRKRFEVPQGLTGWWQVNGRADKPMHLHTEDDLYYIKHYSFWLDLQILFYTVKAVLNRRGSF